MCSRSHHKDQNSCHVRIRKTSSQRSGGCNKGNYFWCYIDCMIHVIRNSVVFCVYLANRARILSMRCGLWSGTEVPSLAYKRLLTQGNCIFFWLRHKYFGSWSVRNQEAPFSPAAKGQKRARGRSRVCPNFSCSLLFTGMCTLILWIIRLVLHSNNMPPQHVKKLQ